MRHSAKPTGQAQKKATMEENGTVIDIEAEEVEKVVDPDTGEVVPEGVGQKPGF